MLTFSFIAGFGGLWQKQARKYGVQRKADFMVISASGSFHW